MRSWVAATAAGLLAVAACGGDAEVTTETDSFESTVSLSQALGCAEYKGVPKRDRVEFAIDQGSCRAGGEEIFLILFETNDDRNRYVNLASIFGRVRLLGDRWVVQGSPETLETLQDDVGGQIHPAQGRG